MEEVALFNKFGKSVYRLCGDIIYDYQGKPRGFLVGKTVYDMRGQHRGFYMGNVMRDRMGKILGFNENAKSNGLELPFPEIPPVPYNNLPAPESKPDGMMERECPAEPPVWSIMQLQNLLV